MFDPRKVDSQGAVGLSRNRYVLAALAALALAALAGFALLSLQANKASAHPPQTTGVETSFTGNPDCESFDLGDLIEELKLDNDPVSGEYTDGTLTVNITVYEDLDFGWYVDWTSNIGVDAVIVKGANGGNIYNYSPEATEDAGLHALVAGGSGKFAGISHLNFCYDVEEDAQGCTLGYWKQPQHAGSWGPTGYTQDQKLNTVFTGINPPNHNKSLLQALSFPGGPGVTGAEQILLRQAVAALLNAAHPDVSYPIDAATVISLVNTALGSDDRDTILSAATTLDAYNNNGCPLSRNDGGSGESGGGKGKGKNK